MSTQPQPATRSPIVPHAPRRWVGSAGRALGSARTIPRLLPPPAASPITSYCFTCSTFHYGSRLDRCPRCSSSICRWFSDSDLHLLTNRGRAGDF